MTADTGAVNRSAGHLKIRNFVLVYRTENSLNNVTSKSKEWVTSVPVKILCNFRQLNNFIQMIFEERPIFQCTTIIELIFYDNCIAQFKKALL